MIHKIIVLGDFGVGKTSLIRRYVLDEFTDEYRATLGVHPYKYSTKYESDSGPAQASLILWDAEGGPVASTPMLRIYMQGASGAIVVGDTTRANTTDNMAETAEIFAQERPGRPIVFALNKCDLDQIVDQNDVDNLAEEFDAISVKTSAKTAEAVRGLFDSLIRRIAAQNL